MKITPDQEQVSETPEIEFDWLNRLEPLIDFLYHRWWRVDFFGLDRIPSEGPCLIVGNQGSVLPWQALMLGYALKNQKKSSRKLYVLADTEIFAQGREGHNQFASLGILDWSSANMKKLFNDGAVVAIFPEGAAGLTRPFSQRYRLEEFDWTMLLPAVEAGVDVYPLASLGFDESNPVLGNFDALAKLLKLPYLPATPFFPWLPLPFNLFQAPVEISMNVLKRAEYARVTERDEFEREAKSLSLWVEGEIQAELNRQLRHRGHF